MIIGKTTDKCNICGQHIRSIREKKRMTQDEFAAKLQLEGLGVNQNSISRIETGKRIVADFELKAIAKVLDIDVNELLKEE